mmetsp:Transcript_45021/g.101329  ORF Transcript_45021/g.101329 Transcript_45021/m.101329 type:complete len:104 (-) Transcript_45021:184-495(-)
MGDHFSRTCQACWDPEGTAAIVRMKKAQRNAINSYKGVLDRFEVDLNNKRAADEDQRDLLKLERGFQDKSEGRFWPELQKHPDWAPLARKAEELRKRLPGGGQ